MKKIGILSDTHGYFDDLLRRFFDGVDELWHAGDIGNVETADKIAAFKPLRAVYGNIDGAPLRRIYPKSDMWTTEQIKVAMTHIGGYPGRYDREVFTSILPEHPDMFIDGHSHILKVMFDKRNNFLFINPGAAGIYGFHKVRTAVRLEVDGKDLRNLEVGEWPRG
ncbi:MAG: metallophosphatase family protein [Rikenellaceae bacterium]|nr:metallophosphatase family protein [Rikenellaceae bacterium]